MIFKQVADHKLESIQHPYRLIIALTYIQSRSPQKRRLV